MRKTLKQVFAEYGAIAVVLYLALFTVVMVGSYMAIRLGWTPESVSAQAAGQRMLKAKGRATDGTEYTAEVKPAK